MTDSIKTVLLFGMPRSGTTWIGKIFDSDRTTLYMHEPDSWQRMGFLPLFVDGDPGAEALNELAQYHAALTELRIPQITTKLPVFRKDYQTIGRYYGYKASIYVQNVFNKMGIGAFVGPLARIGRDIPPSVIVWKSIESLGRLGCVASRIANTYAVHIVRNPAGYIASVLSGEQMHNFRSLSVPTSEDYPLFDMLLSTAPGRALGITIDKLKAMKPIERLAIRWRLYNEIAYHSCMVRENYRLVRYEDVCRAPLDMAKELYSHCGMQLGQQTQEFIAASTTHESTAYYAVYKNPLKAAYHWREKLGEEDIKLICDTLAGSVAFSWYKDDFSDFLS